ncbi:MAG: response regulator transcription factor [Firmicutes bacterium]|nr:response regulator transcription factor [Bacillota bacterium]
MAAAPHCIVIVSPLPVVRIGLRAIFEADASFHVQAKAPEELHTYLTASEPFQTILWDVGSECAILQWLEEFRHLSVPAKWAALIPEDLPQATLQAMIVSFDALLDKSATPDTLIHTMHLLSSCPERNAVLLSPTLWAEHISPCFASEHLHFQENPLTRRESQILSLIQQGYTNMDIAQSLIISPHTVKRHIEHLLKKMQARNRHESVQIAQAQGWLPPSPTRRSSGAS